MYAALGQHHTTAGQNMQAPGPSLTQPCASFKQKNNIILPTETSYHERLSVKFVGEAFWEHALAVCDNGILGYRFIDSVCSL